MRSILLAAVLLILAAYSSPSLTGEEATRMMQACVQAGGDPITKPWMFSDRIATVECRARHKKDQK